MPTQRPKVLVAMSGGVDSSVAAAILLREGYDVVGCFMRLGSPGESLEGLAPYVDSEASACAANKDADTPTRPLKIGHQGCCSINDAADARLVAAQLEVPFYVCNFKRDFGRIIDYFVDEYAAGRTPNPCVRCNDWLKFGKLHEYAKQIGADFIASGHYARIDRSSGAPRLLRGVDRSKDQSYVLFGAPRHRLAEMLLPIGALEKPRVRDMARDLGLPVFDKPDSQEICFVPDNDYAGLVERRRPTLAREGAIISAETGREIGRHSGQHRFTIGQRRGVGVAFGRPLYVVSKNADTNAVLVGERERLASRACSAREVNWLADAARFAEWRPVAAKIRYNAEPVAAEARLTDAGRTLDVRFDEPQFAVAPGQAVVCYDGDVVLGGGWIESAEPAAAD